jgi:hypothetical protein
MENQRFEIGETVYDRVRPWQKLVVTHVDGKLYHCKLHENMGRPAIVYLERDLNSEKLVYTESGENSRHYRTPY